MFRAFVQRAFLLSALILQYLAILEKLSSSFNLIRIDPNPGTVDPTSRNGLLSCSHPHTVLTNHRLMSVDRLTNYFGHYYREEHRSQKDSLKNYYLLLATSLHRHG